MPLSTQEVKTLTLCNLGYLLIFLHPPPPLLHEVNNRVIKLIKTMLIQELSRHYCNIGYNMLSEHTNTFT